MSQDNFDIPVLMYHSVGVPNKKWNWNYLTCPFDRFEEQLIAIKEMGYISISLYTLYNHMVRGDDLPKNSIAITFDDGYADIWIYAYPLLKKHDMCGTVFINPDFVDKRNIKRNLYSNQGNLSELDNTGFLTWNEIITMDQEGVVYSESHALTHTWYPNSPKIIDFRHPNDTYTWMTWNKHRAIKSKLQLDDKSLVNFGTPVYENKKSLISSRYFPNKKLDNKLEQFVENSGGNTFFENKKWKNILFDQVNKFNSEDPFLGKFEGKNEYEDRVREELKYTKELLEEKLNREITILCWPGGSATDIGMKIAKNLGYKFFNAARDLSPNNRRMIKNNRNGGDRIKRFTPFLYWDGQENINSFTKYANRTWMKLILIRYSERYFSKYWFKVLSILKNGYYKIYS